MHRKTEVPTSRVCGQRETRFEQFRRYAEQVIPDLEVANFDGGYAVNIEAAEGFNDVVSRFLNRHGGSS